MKKKLMKIRNWLIENYLIPVLMKNTKMNLVLNKGVNTLVRAAVLQCLNNTRYHINMVISLNIEGKVKLWNSIFSIFWMI